MVLFILASRSSVYDIIIAVCSIVSSLGIIVALFGYFFNRKDYRVKYEVRQKERAVEIAEKYTKLIKSISFLVSLFENLGLGTDINKKLGHNRIDLRFTRDESMQIFQEDYASKIYKSIEINPRIVLSAYMYHFDFSPNIDYIRKKIIKKESLDDSEKLEIDRICRECSLIIIDMLNELEAISMKFNSKLADEEIVYNSLHQSFLRFVILLYPIIASHNKNTVDKYYTNIIKLYSAWNTKNIQNHKKVQKFEEKMQKCHEQQY